MSEKAKQSSRQTLKNFVKEHNMTNLTNEAEFSKLEKEAISHAFEVVRQTDPYVTIAAIRQQWFGIKRWIRRAEKKLDSVHYLLNPEPSTDSIIMSASKPPGVAASLEPTQRQPLEEGPPILRKEPLCVLASLSNDVALVFEGPGSSVSVTVSKSPSESLPSQGNQGSVNDRVVEFKISTAFRD